MGALHGDLGPDLFKEGLQRGLDFIEFDEIGLIGNVPSELILHGCLQRKLIQLCNPLGEFILCGFDRKIGRLQGVLAQNRIFIGIADFFL
ncbi:hypothetical protein D3C72_2048810 [compost metagenome]